MSVTFRIQELEAKIAELEKSEWTYRDLASASASARAASEKRLANASDEIWKLRKQIAELESRLAERNRAAECWEKWKEHSLSLGHKFWFVNRHGALKGYVFEHFCDCADSPEAAVEAVCKPKPEPQLTLRTADPGRWVRARGCDVYYNSPELGVLYYWDGVYRVPNSSFDTPCHYIEDPRKQEVEG